MTTAEKRSEQPSPIPVTEEDLKYTYILLDGQTRMSIQQDGLLLIQHQGQEARIPSYGYLGMIRDQDAFALEYEGNSRAIVKISFAEIKDYLASGRWRIAMLTRRGITPFGISHIITGFEKREKPAAPAPLAHAHAAVAETLDRSHQAETSQAAKIYALLGRSLQKAVAEGRFTQLHAAAMAKRLGYEEAVPLILRSVKDPAPRVLKMLETCRKLISSDLSRAADLAKILRQCQEPELRAYLGIQETPISLELPRETPREQLDRRLMLEKFQERVHELLNSYRRDLEKARQRTREGELEYGEKPLKEDPTLISSLGDKTARRQAGRAFSDPENNWLQAAVTDYRRSAQMDKYPETTSPLPCIVSLLEFLKKLIAEKLGDFLDPDEIAAMQRGIDIKFSRDAPIKVTLVDKYGRPDIEGIYKFITTLLQELFYQHDVFNGRKKAYYLSAALVGPKQITKDPSPEAKPKEALDPQTKDRALQKLQGELHILTEELSRQIGLETQKEEPLRKLKLLQDEMAQGNLLNPLTSFDNTWYKRVTACEFSRSLSQNQQAYLLLGHLHRVLTAPDFLHPAERAMMQRGEVFEMYSIKTRYDRTSTIKLALLNEDGSPNVRAIRDYIVEVLCKESRNITKEQARVLIEPLDEALGETTKLKAPLWTRIKAWMWRNSLPA